MFRGAAVLNEIAESLGITLPQMAIAWTLHRQGSRSYLVGLQEHRQPGREHPLRFPTLPTEADRKDRRGQPTGAGQAGKLIRTTMKATKIPVFGEVQATC